MPGGTYPTDHLMNGVNCPIDPLCAYTLRCWTCSSGYTLNNGFCVKNNQCFIYSLYNSTSLSFNPAYCNCFPNYFSIGLTMCLKCDISCLTCSSGTNCLSCPTGSSGATCSYNSTYGTAIVSWGSGTNLASIGTAGWSGWTISGSANSFSNTGSCSPTNWVFGYYGYSLTTGASLFPSVTLQFAGSGYGTSHYGVKIRANLLFIDQWQNNMSILFS